MPNDYSPITSQAERKKAEEDIRSIQERIQEFDDSQTTSLAFNWHELEYLSHMLDRYGGANSLNDSLLRRIQRASAILGPEL